MAPGLQDGVERRERVPDRAVVMSELCMRGVHGPPKLATFDLGTGFSGCTRPGVFSAAYNILQAGIAIASMIFDHLRYDGRGDVLYLNVRKSRTAASSLEMPDGHTIHHGARCQAVSLAETRQIRRAGTINMMSAGVGEPFKDRRHRAAS